MPFDIQMNAITRAKELSVIKRIGMFVLVTLPGALLTAGCGAGLGAAIAWHDGPKRISALAALVILGGGLLLVGTRTIDKPLFLLVYVPMPILASWGYLVGYVHGGIALQIGFVGTFMPVIVYPLVTGYYKRQAHKAYVAKISSPPIQSPVNQQP